MDERTSLFVLRVGDKEKSLITLTPGVNVIKLFSSIADDEAYKLEHLSFKTVSSQVL